MQNRAGKDLNTMVPKVSYRIETWWRIQRGSLRSCKESCSGQREGCQQSSPNKYSLTNNFFWHGSISTPADVLMLDPPWSLSPSAAPPPHRANCCSQQTILERAWNFWFQTIVITCLNSPTLTLLQTSCEHTWSLFCHPIWGIFGESCNTCLIPVPSFPLRKLARQGEVFNIRFCEQENKEIPPLSFPKMDIDEKGCSK